MQQCTIVTDPLHHYQLLTNPNINVNTVFPISDEVEIITWRYVDEGNVSSNKTSVVLASFITCHARLCLYKCLNELDRKVCYFDTDSIIYETPEGDEGLPNGDYLGQLTDELAQYGKGSYIKECCSGGPKNYAFIVCKNGVFDDTVTVCTVRGISINSGNNHLVNFASLKEMVTADRPPIIVPIPHQIGRKNRFDVVTRPTSKVFRVVHTKRKLLDENYDSILFGFKRVCSRYL